MWTVAALNKKYSDALGTYNSLYDPHLHQYFRKPKVRSHLIQAGLMTSEGKIIPEALVKLRKLEEQRRQQLHSLLTEVLEKGKTNGLALQRLHETRDLESEAKQELVRRAKIAFGSSTEESTAPTTRTHSYNSSSDRRTTTSTIQSSGSMNWLRRVVQIRPKLFNARKGRVNNNYQRCRRPKSSYGIRSSNKVKPDLRAEQDLNEQFSDILSLDGESIHDSDDSDSEGYRRSGFRSSKTSKTSAITLRFNGLTGNSNTSRRVQISQQLYSGGNAITIFDRLVAPGEYFTFNVRPHGNKPFSMTVLIDGIRDLRVSTCCEHKHKKGSKISHFTLVEVRGGKVCANCKKGIDFGKRSSVVKSCKDNEKKKKEDIGSNDKLEDKRENCMKVDDKTSDKIDDNESEVEEVDEQTVIDLEKESQSKVSSQASDNDNEGEDQFENYESEFEAESQESLRLRSNSSSSNDNTSIANGRQEVIEAEIHKAPE